MNISQVSSYVVTLLRYWLVIAILLFFGLAIAAQPIAWAASVTAPPNQTIPGRGFQTFLPIIKFQD